MFCLECSFFGLNSYLSLRVGGLNDSQCEIKKEESTDKDHGYKKEYDQRRVGLLVHDHDFGPAFKSDALEDIEQGPEDIVKVGHIIVGIERHLTTEVSFWAS